MLVLVMAGTVSAGKLTYASKTAPAIETYTWVGGQTFTIYFDTLAGAPTYAEVRYYPINENYDVYEVVSSKVGRQDLVAGYITLPYAELGGSYPMIRGFLSNKYGDTF